MEKTYSRLRLICIIDKKDIELARLREAHKRDLETVATEYQNSLAEVNQKIEYWQDSTATARKERDKLYGEVIRWQEECNTLRKERDNLEEGL